MVPLFSLTATQSVGGQIALAAVLAVAGFALLLPRPRGRFVPGGIAALVAALAVFGAWLHTSFGRPMPDLIGSLLFGLFSLGALGFGTVLVVQANPARGAIAFAFVILSTCGLFLLLAAPFLMAATIIIYAGAIIVTFLFVLMLSQVQGPSDENDRSREPLFGGLAGFAFVGLVLFTLYLSSPDSQAKADGLAPRASQRLPAPVLTADERAALLEAAAKVELADGYLDGDPTARQAEQFVESFESAHSSVAFVVGSRFFFLPPEGKKEKGEDRRRDGTIRVRLEKVQARPGVGGSEASLYREDAQTKAALARAEVVRKLNDQTLVNARQILENKKQPDVAALKADIQTLRGEVLLLAGSGELPARNVGNLGYLLFADYLLAVELAGTLLLVATIGAVAIAHKKRQAGTQAGTQA